MSASQRWLRALLRFVTPLAVAACATIARPPEPVATEFLGCFDTNLGELRSEFADSFLSALPESVELTSREVARPPLVDAADASLEIIPNDPEYPRFWTRRSFLPSERGRPEARRSYDHPFIPGDSADLHLRGPVGTLVLRVKVDADGDLRGRSEWVNQQRYPTRVPPRLIWLKRHACR